MAFFFAQRATKYEKPFPFGRLSLTINTPMAQLRQLQTQAQVLAPQLRQSLKILQVSALDLREMIREEISTNPALEEVPTMPEVDGKRSDAFDAYGGGFEHNTDRSEAVKRHEFMMASLTSEETLQEHLSEQVGCMELPKKLREVVEFIIGSLNEKGFLELSEEELARQTASEPKQVTAALAVVQNLDPIGVGCKDTVSSLLVQLKHQNKEQSLAFKILSEHYDALIHNKFIDIAEACSVTIKDVRAAVRNDIATLNPAPGSAFASNPTHTVIPDVRIYKNHLNEWMVELNRQYIPNLRIGSDCKMLLAKQLKPSERSYLRLKMRAGQFFIRAILQRQKTIEDIARALLRWQTGFFERGATHLKPLTMQMLADDLGIHETTVSRATANKYIDTPFGVFGFKYFFTKGLRGISGGRISNSVVRQRIKRIVEDEDRRSPLSDQQIATLLAKEQVNIARRTVTKYRESLGILPASLRRQYD